MPRCTLYVIAFFICSFGHSMARRNRVEEWGSEVMGDADSIVSAQQQESYKQNLLEYVFQTHQPSAAELNSDGNGVPYVMSQLYDALADKQTGEKKSALVDVDFIRGLEDHWETERRMQFWFNASTINETEDIIEAYFHIYKRRPNQVVSPVPPAHVIAVNLYKIVDEATVYAEDGNIGAGAELLERQQVSCYTEEWIIFHTNLSTVVKDWVKNPTSNKGFLISATDRNENHVNGTHIDFVQRGEQPHAKQPVFVVYTDQDKKKKKNKAMEKVKSNIDIVVKTLLNEGTDMVRLERECRESAESTELCSMVVLRQRRSVLDQPPSRLDPESEMEEVEDDGYDDEWEDNSIRARRRLRTGPLGTNADLAIEATRRTNNFCQKKPLYVSFHALGWGKWIVAPEGLNANYCDGACPFPLTSTLTASNHAVLQSVSNYYHPDQVKPPCCVPQKLSKMSILYHQTEKTVTMRNYDNMIVESCSCR